MHRAAYRLCIAALIFSPLAFGTVETWSTAIMECLAFLALSLLLLDRSRSGDISLYRIPGILPLALFLSFMVFQLIPLPPGLLSILSPSTAVYRDIPAAGEGGWTGISLNTRATVEEFFRYASYAAVYILAVQLLATREGIRKAVAVVLLLGVVIAFFGTIQHLIPNKKIYWVRELTQGGTPFGPFVNRNHYAGFIGMLFPLAFSLFFHHRPVVRRERLRQKLAGFFNHPLMNVYAFLGFASLLMATSIFLSLSRGGIASLSMALVLLGLLLNRSLRQRRVQLFFIISIVVILYAVGWFGWGPVFERFRAIRTMQGEIAELRLDIWKDSLGIIRDFPLFGTGAGSFISIYPVYRSITAGGVADHAHNDYVELLTDSGGVGALFFFWFLAEVIFRSYRTFLTRKDPFLVHLYSGSLAGIFSLLLHSFTDFNLHIGSNGLYFFFLLGLLVATSHTKMQQHNTGSLLGKAKAPARLLGMLAVSLLFLSMAFHGGRLLAGLFFQQVQQTNLVHASPADISLLSKNMQRAIRFDPLEPEYHYRLGSLELLINGESATERFQRAVRLAPANGEYILSLGMVLQGPGQDDTAERLLRLGISRDRTNPLLHKKYASWLKKQDRGDEGLASFRKAVALEPANTRSHISQLVLLGYSDAEIGQALPDQAEAHILFADYLEKTGKGSMAADAYRTAVSLETGGKEPRPSVFIHVHDFFARTGMNQEALRIMEKAVLLVPDSAEARLRYAGALEKAERRVEAIAEYEAALRLDPKNAAAKRRLEELR